MSGSSVARSGRETRRRLHLQRHLTERDRAALATTTTQSRHRAACVGRFQLRRLVATSNSLTESRPQHAVARRDKPLSTLFSSTTTIRRPCGPRSNNDESVPEPEPEPETQHTPHTRRCDRTVPLLLPQDRPAREHADGRAAPKSTRAPPAAWRGPSCMKCDERFAHGSSEGRHHCPA